MAAFARQPSPASDPGSKALERIAEQNIATLIGELIRDGGLVLNLSGNKPGGIADLVHKDLGAYRYFALYGFGRHVQDVPKHELDLMLSRLSNFMKGSCLMVSDTELDGTPEDAPVRSFYLSFADRPENEAFVAIATVYPGINDKIFKRPAYHGLRREDHAGWDEALDHALEKLRASLLVGTLANIPLPGLPSAKKNLVCPNWEYIRQRRKKAGPMESLCALDIATPSRPGKHKVSKTTLIKAEKGEPVRPSTIEDIAKVLKAAPGRLIFKNIVPNVERLRELRKAVVCTEEELLGQFGLSSMALFHLLEEAAVVPADTMRYVHHHYGKLLGPQAGAFTELVYLPGTKALAGQA